MYFILPINTVTTSDLIAERSTISPLDSFGWHHSEAGGTGLEALTRDNIH